MENFDLIQIDMKNGKVIVERDGKSSVHALESAEAFSAISQAWLRGGWDTKYVYSFAWLGRPVIQLPEDMFRIQEVIYRLKPDVIIETGIAHGGSLIFYASLCKAMDKGRVIGIDIKIRPYNRKAIEEHELSSYITLVEGNSVAPEIVEQVRSLVGKDKVVLILLDSNHSKDHVYKELCAYAPLVSAGSYIVACDGIMATLGNAPRAHEDWIWNNPIFAIDDFLSGNPDFIEKEPTFPFNEGLVNERVTYWPRGFLMRVK